MVDKPAAPANAGKVQLAWREINEHEPLRTIEWGGVTVWYDHNGAPVALDVPPGFTLNVVDDGQDEAHTIRVEPIEKLGGIAGYRFVCSCGRIGNGSHGTMEGAWAGGLQHARDKRALPQAESEYS